MLSCESLTPHCIGSLGNAYSERCGQFASHLWRGTTDLDPHGGFFLFIVDQRSPYNAILGKPILNVIQAIVSTYHLVMKFLIGTNGVGINRGDQAFNQECYAMATKAVGKAHQVSTIY